MNVPSFVETSTSTVGFPRESIISRAFTHRMEENRFAVCLEEAFRLVLRMDRESSILWFCWFFCCRIYGKYVYEKDTIFLDVTF